MCTKDDMINLEEKLQKVDIVDRCTREENNTKCRFCKLSNVTVIASLLKCIPMGCDDTVIPEPLLKNRKVNCLTFERNARQPYNDYTCLF